MKIFLPLVLFGLFLLSACSLSQTKVTTVPQNTNVASGTPVSILLPTADSLKYCNGADMDSAGFKKIITQKEIITLLETNLSLEQLANKMLTQAALKAGIAFPQPNEELTNYIKVKDQIAYIEPTDGWAGVSIYMCSWQPFVEVNLLNLTGINQVIWVNEPNTWQELNKSLGQTAIFFLIPNQDKSNFCQGSADPQKESQAFKETLVKQMIKLIPNDNYSTEDLIKKTLSLANLETGLSPYPPAVTDYLKIIGPTAYLRDPDGYAGRWHDLCLWQPFVEVNLLRFPEIKTVVWIDDLQKWQELSK